eukprot:m.239105 g.239105  ORF g.239105 m.239105 type:complete len:377 (-) comp19404_c0_seq15:2613-3743(-)
MSFTPRGLQQQPSDDVLSRSRERKAVAQSWEPRTHYLFTARSRAMVMHIYLCACRMQSRAQDQAEYAEEITKHKTCSPHTALSLPIEMWAKIISFLGCYPETFQDHSIFGLLPGIRDGALSQALLHRPNFVATTSHGEIVITDWTNGALRQIDASGTHVSTISHIPQPWGIASSTRGDLYVVSGNQIFRLKRKDMQNENHNVEQRVVEYEEPVSIAGYLEAGFADGEGQTARFNRPRGIAIAQDIPATAPYDIHTQLLDGIPEKEVRTTCLCIVVADQENHRIRQLRFVVNESTGDIVGRRVEVSTLAGMMSRHALNIGVKSLWRSCTNWKSSFSGNRVLMSNHVPSIDHGGGTIACRSICSEPFFFVSWCVSAAE